MKSLGKWAVVDEESMSTEPNAAILAIGATMIDDLETVDRFYVNVDLQSCLAVGLHESESTRNWWKQQSATAFEATQTNCVPIQTALQMWSDWIGKHGGKSVRLMGNGPCADNMWLNSAYKACNAADPSPGMKNPVPYWNDICHRTLNWVGGKWLGVTKDDVTFKGVKHHAGDDAEHEAQHAIMVLNALQDALVYKELNRGVTATLEPTGATTMSISKQEFILNNITEMVRAGRVEGLPKLAADLAEVYDVSCDVQYAQSVTDGVATKVTDTMAVPSALQSAVDTDTTSQQVESLAVPHEATILPSEIPTAPVADVPPAERTHDDWGLPFSEEWHVSTRNTAKPGYFKRKPGTNEEQYAAFIQQCVIEAGDAFAGPDNWATVSRLAKYLDPVQATPDAPQVADAPTLQPQAETVGQAMHTGATAEAAPVAAPSVEAAHVAAPTAPVGASAASEVPNMSDMMTAHMVVCQGFGVADTRHKAVLERLDAANIMQIKDENKAWFVNASRAVADQLEVIKADASGEMLKTVLDSVTA
ncbi:ribonuclease H-like domain protein [Vibrio phage 1.250.O._10N.261.55.E11]|nr:ribonuclease H-like domain protein [Vibrio phage 1.250.O._10N.261.55.E11]